MRRRCVGRDVRRDQELLGFVGKADEAAFSIFLVVLRAHLRHFCSEQRAACTRGRRRCFARFVERAVLEAQRKKLLHVPCQRLVEHAVHEFYILLQRVFVAAGKRTVAECAGSNGYDLLHGVGRQGEEDHAGCGAEAQRHLAHRHEDGQVHIRAARVAHYLREPCNHGDDVVRLRAAGDAGVD